jgi:transposase
LQEEVAKAKQRFGLPTDAPMYSCYEAGRDGFGLHRYLIDAGLQNLIVDSASIEVNRRQRRAQSDRLDVGQLLTMLVRYDCGEKKVWSMVRVPSVGDEDRRQLHRELEALKDERTQYSNRVQGLLASQGLDAAVNKKFPQWLAEARLWDGSAVPAELRPTWDTACGVTTSLGAIQSICLPPPKT